MKFEMKYGIVFCSVAALLSGCVSYPPLPERPKYSEPLERFDTTASCCVYPAGNTLLRTSLFGQLKKHDYSLWDGRAVMGTAPSRPDRVIHALSVRYYFWEQKEERVLDTRILIMVRDAGFLSQNGLFAGGKRFFQAWSRSVFPKNTMLTSKHYAIGLQSATENLFKIPKFRHALAEHRRESENISRLRKLAINGNRAAAERLAQDYEAGKNGAPISPLEAVKWATLYYPELSSASEQVLCRLVVQNALPNRAAQRQMLQVYAEDGKTEMQFLFGRDLLDPDAPGEENPALAVQMFQKAAEKGHVGAMNQLGLAYENGIGVEVNGEEAVRFYRKAAMQGYADAKYNLGHCYENAVGVERDLKQAKYWYEEAQKAGCKKAKDALTMLESDSEPAKETMP